MRQELLANPSSQDKEKEEAFIVESVLHYFEKPVPMHMPPRQMESTILSALHRYFQTK